MDLLLGALAFAAGAIFNAVVSDHFTKNAELRSEARIAAAEERAERRLVDSESRQTRRDTEERLREAILRGIEQTRAFFLAQERLILARAAGRDETNRDTDFPHADATLLGDPALMAKEIQLWADLLPRPLGTPMSRLDLERMAQVHSDVIRALNDQETQALAGRPLREVDRDQAATIFTAELQQRLASQILGPAEPSAGAESLA